MGIQTFEMFHGAVLAKIMRTYGDRPVVLRLVEARPEEYWSVYTLNDEVHLVIKYRTRARKLSRDRLSWAFVFSLDEVRQITSLQQDKKTYIALVGGQRCIGETMEVGLLSDDEFMRLVRDNTKSSLSLTLRYERGHQLRLLHNRRIIYKIPRSKLDTWNVPGG